MNNTKIVTITMDSTLNKVRSSYISESEIMKWNHASDDRFCPKATNELKVGGKFNYRMEAKDGSI